MRTKTCHVKVQDPNNEFFFTIYFNEEEQKLGVEEEKEEKEEEENEDGEGEERKEEEEEKTTKSCVEHCLNSQIILPLTKEPGDRRSPSLAYDGIDSPEMLSFGPLCWSKGVQLPVERSAPSAGVDEVAERGAATSASSLQPFSTVVVLSGSIQCGDGPQEPELEKDEVENARQEKKKEKRRRSVIVMQYEFSQEMAVNWISELAWIRAGGVPMVSVGRGMCGVSKGLCVGDEEMEGTMCVNVPVAIE
ncbi:hypothetical protein H920_15193 [Fukomys damarensis]|uniref:Uncharacterized protein n=1 Tax=Fukomys damarensis TaxID=885580 RepID=A0A091CYW0_FUKDA|nr:hypothetical protein H920_15193 [Fukomys damarensis]